MIRQVYTRFLQLFCIVLTSVVVLKGQNIAPNPDLEFHTFCPTGYSVQGQGPPLPCVPWDAATWGSADYFHSCSNPSEVGVPLNDVGWQLAHSGEGYAGLILKASNPLDYREYLGAPLLQPLIGGKYYYTSFYVSLANSRCGIQQIGAYFSSTPPPYTWGDALPLDNLTPQVESNGNFLSDTTNWMLIEGCFRAQGGEAYITIGNFHTNADTPLDPNCSVGASGSYYYFDDIYVSEVQPGGINVELGNDLSACYSQVINAGISGVDYYWSTGSTDPSITVFTSGEYYLTVYNGCEAGVDSVHVQITNSAPVEISPSSIDLCPGGSVSVQLDPFAGNYLWPDGSTASTYTINATGVYTVTLDDGCDLSSDSIAVTIVNPPAPFSLGGDTLLCTGSQLELFFDPDLGNFTWQDGSTSNSFIVTHAGDYALTISNMCGESSDALTVTEVMPAILILPVSTYTLCNGQSLEISLDTTLGPYVWQDGTMGTDYIITTSGLYSVTMSDYCGPSSDSVLVTAIVTPVVDLGDTLKACPGDTLTLTQNGALENYTWQDGSTNDSLIVTTPGNYALTIENACGMDSDSVVVLYQNALLPVDLGPDVHLCPGDTVVLFSANTGASFLWQDGSTADSLLIDTAGTYYVKESNSCYSLSDTVVVFSDSQPPSIVLPNPLTLCQGSIDTLDPGLSGVTYIWNDGTQNSTLIISSPGNYSLTVSNTCGSDVDTVQVLDGGPPPSVSLGSDIALCPGDTITLTPTFTAGDTWLWPDGSTAPSYAVSDSGIVDVMVGNTCGVAFDTVTIDLLEAIPMLDLGPDTSLCSVESLTLSILFPNVNIQWSDGSSNADFVINGPGTYYASISNACGISSDTITVGSFAPIPSLDLGPDIPLCPGEEVTLIPGIPNVDYLWQDGSTDTFLLVDHDQTVWLAISNACGTSIDSTHILLNNNGPVVDLGPDVLACAGQTVTLVSDIANVSFLWQDGSTNSSFSTSNSGIYYLQVSNVCGTDIDSVVVDIHGVPPSPSLGADTSLCEGTTLALTSNADAETTTTWQNGSTNLNYVVTAPGMYSLTQSNHCGQNADSITITYQPLPVDINLGPDTILCPGETLLLIAPVTSDQLTWQDGSSAPTFLANQAGTFSLTSSNICGMKTDELILSYDDKIPQFPAQDHFELCPGNIIILDVTQPFVASYLWNTGSTAPSISITDPDLYSVTVTTDCQQASQNIEVVVKKDCSFNGDFFIPNVISPNDDNINDVFTFSTSAGVEIISIEGSIFDRWGGLVFSSSDNPFIWNGKFNDENVEPGVYVYALHIKYRIDGREVSRTFTGDVTVIR
jgi:gliding motility-associated-like protein